ncbi:endocuticle structural glycoprotein ABD-4 isoform X2 [Leptinotarsa decemlineata]|uniref:endocuticle structural glycoprotein ABD-4 isoform X2 n=1 Tax=Leptinotarsa decemlineata TaxID=7539 RepID=UPI003D3081B7
MVLIFLQVLGLLAIITISFAEEQPLQQQNPNEPIAIVKYENVGVNEDGSYQWSYETANGISAQEEGHLKKSNSEEEGTQEVSGSFQYTANDGTPIKLTYTANENGFQPEGEHLPTAPPVPPAIQRSLDFIAANPPVGGAEANETGK